MQGRPSTGSSPRSLSARQAAQVQPGPVRAAPPGRMAQTVNPTASTQLRTRLDTGGALSASNPNMVRAVSTATGPMPAATTALAGTQAYKSVTFPDVLYVTLHKGTKDKGKLKRKTLHFRAIHNNKGWWVGKHINLFYHDSWFYQDNACYVLSKSAPNDPDQNIMAYCSKPAKNSFMPPDSDWESDKYDAVQLTLIRPKDWIEGDVNEGRERVGKLLAAIKKTVKDGEWNISVKDICRNIDAVKEILPELLTEFPRIDADGNGKVTVEELEHYFDPGKKREYPRAKLDQIWHTLIKDRVDDSRPMDSLTLEDLSTHLEYIDEKVPELMECFQDIDLDRSCRIHRYEFDAYFGDASIWLESKLINIIGLGDLKEQINQFYNQQRLDRLRRRAGVMVNNDEAIVILFKGHPGTGKTTIGRILTGLLYKIGVIKTETFIECQRDDLVGDHIGATEKLTAAKIEEAKGGVMFVDEAYRLNSDIFGVEAINTLMRAMTVKGTVMILAGYPKQMDEFRSKNPGLARRITYEMEFPNYTCSDLAKILEVQIKKRGFQVEENVTVEFVADLLSDGRGKINEQQRSCFNGGIGEHISRHAIFNLNRRESARLVDLDLREQQGALEEGETGAKDFCPSITLTREDIEYAVDFVPQPPPEDIANNTALSRTSHVTISR